MAKRIHRINKVLQKTLRKMDLDVKLEGYRIWLLWTDIVGEQIATRAQPERLRNRILFVKVSSSTWMQQLQTMKHLLLERIQKVIKQAVIEDIRFSLGEVASPASVPFQTRSELEPEEITLSEEMEASLAQIDDSELRCLVKSIMVKQAGKLPQQAED